MSDSASEIIEIDASEDTNQATRRGTVQLNIFEDDENVKSEPCCADCLKILLIMIISCFISLIFVLVICSMIGGYIYLIVYMFSLQTTVSEIFGCILLAVLSAAAVLSLLCFGGKESEP